MPGFLRDPLSKEAFHTPVVPLLALFARLKKRYGYGFGHQHHLLGVCQQLLKNESKRRVGFRSYKLADMFLHARHPLMQRHVQRDHLFHLSKILALCCQKEIGELLEANSAEEHITCLLQSFHIV